MMKRNQQFHAQHLRCRTALVVMTFACTLSGCQSFPRLAVQRPFSTDVERDSGRASIADVQGPTERKLHAARWEQQRAEMARDPQSEFGIAYARLESAQELYDGGNYREAEKAFLQLAKDRRKTYESFQARVRRWWGSKDSTVYDPFVNFGDPVEEDALFMTGESQFAQQRFASAQDSYDDLLNRYPNSRHVDNVTRQLFRIARHWLEFNEDVSDSGDAEVRLASAEQPRPGKSGFNSRGIAVLPNVTDKSRPVFDTYGRGLQALKSIWLHDATGPLADDALMLTANHHLRRENFVEAARHFTLLREQYPDSPHFQDAFILGSHVALAAYEGPAYDATSLHESINLKETTLQMFPQLDPEQRSRLETEIERLQEAEVGRLWEFVDFYKRKDIPESVALHCYVIINRHPDSKYAEMARQTLREIEPQLQQANNTGRFWQLRRSPQSGDSDSPAADSQDDESRMTLPAESDPSVEADAAASPPRKRRPFGFLRRAESSPNLQQVPEEAASSAETGKADLP